MRRTSVCSLLRISTALLVLSAFTIATAISASTAPAFQPVGESVTIYAGDCSTPQTVFNPGDTVCVQAANFPLAPDAGYRYRRIAWVSPSREIIEERELKSDPDYDRIAIPASGSTGTWYVTTLNVESGRYADAKFVVRKDRAVTADLSIYKDGPSSVYAGQRVEFALSIYNPGPDTAEGIEFTTEVPSNMTFVALKQASGPLFECKTPARGETGRIYCSTKGMRLDESARLYAYYDVSREVKEGTVCSATTNVTSYTEELNKEDNFTKTETTVVLENPPILEEPPPEDGE
ncbi:MAG: hypothetical protein QOE47_227 [Pyrinomonadaceae bacterium]|nr:hypothetical protein [Pyrinomonadaceae bacterium]